MTTHQPHPGPTELRGLVFQWAIRFPDGQYYTGPIHVRNKDGERTTQRVDKAERRGPIHQAYTYARNRAEVVIIQNPSVFEGCVAERIL